MRLICLLLIGSCSTLAAATFHETVHTDEWPDDGLLMFTWAHVPSGTERSYVWNLGADSATLIQGGQRTTFATDEEPQDEAARKAHQSFVNDSYWLAFEHICSWDGSTVQLLEAGQVPGRTDTDPLQRIAVTYEEDQGYTPGDRYILYVDDAGLPGAWSYFPGGAEDPKMTTTREDWQSVGETGALVPTRFVQVGGEVFITISGLDHIPE